MTVSPDFRSAAATRSGYPPPPAASPAPRVKESPSATMRKAPSAAAVAAAGGRRRDRSRGRVHGLAEAALQRRGEARGEDGGGRETERGGEKPEDEAAAGERHGGVLCRKTRTRA